MSVHQQPVLYQKVSGLQQLVLQLEVFVQQQSVLCQEMSGMQQLVLHL